MVDDSAREIAETSARWDRALKEREIAVAAEILHDGFALVLVHPVEGVMPRQQWLQLLPEYVVHKWEIQEQVIDVDGDTGAVLRRIDMSATVAGQDRSGIFIISDVWRKTDAQWKVWRRHSTPMAAGELSTGLPDVIEDA